MLDLSYAIKKGKGIYVNISGVEKMLYIIHSGQSTSFLVFSVNGNPLLSRIEVSAFEESVQSFHTELFSLTELTAREIIRKNLLRPLSRFF